MNKIITVKINGELVDPNTEVTGIHLCGESCPTNFMMTCPKVRELGRRGIMGYDFIEEGKQIINPYQERNGDRFLVTKCKRYNEAVKKVNG